jgi:DNA helicase II / ATP-dependent DNA helicase PcrA
VIPTVDQAHIALTDRNEPLLLACSRPKKRLVILFTQQLSGAAMRKVQAWFGDAVVEGIAI